MAADESDEKKPEPDPWADITADNLGSDSGGDADDASAFDFLDMNDDTSSAPAEDPFTAAASATDANPFDFSAPGSAVPGSVVPGSVVPGSAPPELEAEEEMAAAGFDSGSVPAEGAIDEWPIAEEAGTATPVDIESFETDTALAEELADELFAETPHAADSPALSVFAPEESAAVHEPSPSTIEIGTGLSGLRLDEAEAAEYGSVGDAAADGTSADGASDDGTSDDFGFGEAFSADAGSEPEFSVAEAAAPAAVAVASTVASRGAPAKPAAGRKAKGGIGQILGVVLGGLMAIPIVLGILVGLMWLGWPDTLGLRKSLPSALAFLLPPKPPSGRGTLPAGASGDGFGAGATGAGGSALDDLAASAGLMPDDSSANGDTGLAGNAQPAPPDAFAAAGDLPIPDALPDLDTSAADSPVLDPAASDSATAAVLADDRPDDSEPDGSGPDGNTLAALGTPPALPGIDDFDAAVLGGRQPEPAVPVVEPLDMSALDAAVAAADEAFTTVAGIDDFNDRFGRRQLIEWYRSLARVAEECARLERAAADSARPFDGAPKQVVDLHARIAADGQLAEQLARLGPMWLAFERRDSEGVMLVAEFDRARPVGPWWLSTVVHAGEDGERRELSVVSRSEPTVAAGDPVFITGVIFGDDVVWASDCRSALQPRPISDEAAADPVDRPVEEGRPAADDIFSVPGF